MNENPQIRVRPGSSGIARQRLLGIALGLRFAGDAAVAAHLGWGRRPSWERARAAAARDGLPLWTAEDGFIRSLGLGVAGAEPFGFVLDRRGWAVDATGPSDLEDVIRAGEVDPQAAELRQRVVAERVSKYNQSARAPELPPTTRRRVLLVDQTTGDAALRLGLVAADAWQRMAEAAVRENPGAEVLVKVHPDVLAGKRRGCLDPALVPPGATLLATDCDPYALLAAVEVVYTATSQLGFEALLAGRTVVCFGMPWYAGWGLTDDRVPAGALLQAVAARRGVARSLDQVFTAAFLRYTRYADPVLAEPCGLERILDRIADHRRIIAAERGRWWLVGLSWRKRRMLPRFLPGAEVHCVSERKAIATALPGDRVGVWGVRSSVGLTALAARLGTPIARCEDGFVRSVGLGSDLVKPGSLVLDDQGIYFDPGSPSRLETLLREHEFTPAELHRGAALVAVLRDTGVTKYNAGAQRSLILPTAATNRCVVLVPGQVEDDASIQRGGGAIRRNAELLRAARAGEPGAFIIYKPHPDVLAGNRQGAVSDAVLAEAADLVVTDVGMDACLRVVDAVHTITSLTGFEALVHGRRVVCHGLPFYAGWGLTSDRQELPRRGRRLPLEALVLATLFLYPRYLDWRSGWFCGPEAMIELLRRQRAANPAAILRPRWRRVLSHLLSAWPGRRPG